MAKARTPEELALERQQRIKSLRHQEQERRARALAQRLGLPYRDLATTPMDGSALTLKPLEEQQAADAIIFQRNERKLLVAAENPQSPAFTAFLAQLAEEGFEPSVVVVSRASLERSWPLYHRFAYLQTRITGEVKVNEETFARFREEIINIGTLTDRLAKIQPHDVTMLVELLLAGAIRLDASDVHIEPTEEGAKIRYRLDGVLHDLIVIPIGVYRHLLERIKLLAGLKLNITHRGQDGRFSIRGRAGEIEIRVSTLPGRNGEFIVMRVLNPESLLDIGQLGLREDLIAIAEEELTRPHGMLLTTGPTGSGKTTMLYAFLRKVATPEVKIITIEDPIEYHLPGIEQTQVDPAAGYTFASGLRSIVRQDPDIILVGEIRDNETAGIAINAGLTGHLVFSTLHTNDAAGAIPRLVDLGVNPNVLAPAINLIMAQRLVRRVCEQCSAVVTPTPEVRKKIAEILGMLPEHLRAPLDLKHFSLREARGCLTCHRTGYRGRIGIFEMFRVGEEFDKFVLSKPSIAEVRAFAIAQGMVVLQQDALLRAIAGVTTLAEVIRVTGPLVLPHEAQVPLVPVDVEGEIITQEKRGGEKRS